MEFECHYYPACELIWNNDVNSKINFGLFVGFRTDYVYFPIFSKADWSIVRLIWIAYFKNDSNDQCYFDLLPKDIILCIIDLLQTFFLNDNFNAFIGMSVA